MCIRLVCPGILLAIFLSGGMAARGEDAEPISPKDAVIQLFNGKNLDGLYTWLSDTKYEDPRKVFTVEDGMIHISGDGMGYICTKQRYKDYHLVVEYRWGDRTWLSRKTNARDSGVIVHCAEPDGSFGNMFMAGIEAQIIEGGTGDFSLCRASGPTAARSPSRLPPRPPRTATARPSGKRAASGSRSTAAGSGSTGSAAIPIGKTCSASAASRTSKARERSGPAWT